MKFRLRALAAGAAGIDPATATQILALMPADFQPLLALVIGSTAIGILSREDTKHGH